MNKGEFYDLLSEYLENEEQSFMDNRDVFVKLAEEDIARQVQLPHCRKNATSTFIAGNPYLSVPGDFLSTYSLSAIIENSHVALLSKEVDFLREFWPRESDMGVPRFWAQFDHNSVIIAPTPEQAYACELHYYGKPDSLVDVPLLVGTTWLLANAENALLFGTLMQGYIYMKGDQDVINGYKMQFDKAVAALQIIYEGRQRKDSFRNIDKRQPV